MLTYLEILALAMIATVAIKELIFLIAPKSFLNFSGKFHSNPIFIQGISLALAGGVLYLLIQSGLTIVHILAVMVFVLLLLVLGMTKHLNLILKSDKDQMKKGNYWRENWLYNFIWLILLIWGLKEIFM